MELADWHIGLARPVLATAIHDGHDLRPEVARRLVLDEATRKREEDPFTGHIAAGVGSHVTVNRSRFEVDLNRPRDGSVYASSDEAWGLDLWERDHLDPEVADRSRALHDAFYQRLADVLDELVDRHGGFVLYDVHSYNHRRGGPDAAPDDPAEHPQVNLGTASMPDRWRPVADAFLACMRTARVAGAGVDARENVKFGGNHMARFVHEGWGEVGCALAIEFRKDFMDEWTGRVDPTHLDALTAAMAAGTASVWEAHQHVA